MVNVLSAYKRAEFDLREFTDVVTMDFIYRYIDEILDVMFAETANLRNTQVSEEEVSRFMKQIQKAKEAIAKKILHKINEDDLITLDDIIRVLPSGKCDIDEEYHQRRKYEKN